MNGTLSIQGDLALLSELALKIEAWFPDALETSVESDSWGGWTVDRMALLLGRVHPWQLLLVSFVARGDGLRRDPEVRALFSIGDSGLKGQTGAISKHIEAMKKTGLLPDDASHVLRVDRSGAAPMFVIPGELMPIVESALELPQIERALEEARRSQDLEERE
ncbi:hypothetical protein ACSBPH_13770 [Microbacterium sp. F51-2R]|uniref:hypothetical protein n=1 Tax=Microbacterium sp. F51-2R TaxID=3445777 RepID=UPI003FA01775